MTFHQRKKERTEHYEKYVKGWKLRPCSACNGSGRYDSHGSPACSACDGTGKESYDPAVDGLYVKRKEAYYPDEWSD